MTDLNLGVKPGDTTPPDDPDEKKAPDGSEPVKTPEEIAKELLAQDRRILVDKDRFNEINDQSKLYKTFAPVIEKIKDKPELVEKLLEIKEKGSLEDRVAQMEGDRKAEKRRELTEAVKEALSKWKGFADEWSEIQDQVDMLSRRGVPVRDAIRRSYIALHPEAAEEEARVMAEEHVKATGQFQPGGSRAPNVVLNKKEEISLTENQRKVAQDLLGKSYGSFAPVKSEEDYAKLLKKHDAYLRKGHFFDLP